MTTAAGDASLPIRHVSESACCMRGCDQIAELGEALCWQHGGGEWVEQLRERQA
ncbi:hypothetical protein [Myceligenerans halotolerans]